MIGYPCDNCHCINWDSDQNGGHCMLLSPQHHYNTYTNQYYCDSFQADKEERIIITKRRRKPRG